MKKRDTIRLAFSGAVAAVLAIAGTFTIGAYAADQVHLVRTLAGVYVPGKTMTVTLESSDWMKHGDTYLDIYETVPAGWAPGWSDHSITDFDDASGTIYWKVVKEGLVSDFDDYPFVVQYELTPPGDSDGVVSFEGSWSYLVYAFPLMSGENVPTIGDDTLPRHQPVVRRVPEECETIQSAVEASLFGDTVLVSARSAPYLGDVKIKRGLELRGAGGSPPPKIEGSVEMAEHTKVRGLHVSGYGITAGRRAEISSCLITGVPWAGIYFNHGSSSVTNCTIVGNICGVYAGTNNPTIIVANCIFRDNGSPEPIPPFPSADVSGAHVTFSCLESGIYMGSGENNIYTDPAFVAPRAGDYTLRPGSPCIDAADNSFVSPGDVDIAGNPRILNGGRALRADMGAYEHRVPPPVVDAVVGEFGLKWSSTPGKTYSIFFSDDLATWQLADENVPASTRDVTIWLDPIGWPPTVPARFYRITQNE